MKKIAQGAASVLVAAGMIFGSSLAASAEEGTDAPIVETQQVEEAVVQEEAPVTEGEVVPEEASPIIEGTKPPVEEPVVITPPKTEEPEVPVETKTLRWTLPDGGTPDNVTWPQPVFNSELIPCGETVWVQVDVYPYTTDDEKARTDALDDDGILVYGEDHGWTISWSFEQFTAEECVIVPPKPESKIEYRDASSLDCVADLVTTTKEARINEPVYNAESNTWVDGEWTDWTLVESEVRKATDEECPVVVPPTEEPPVVEPPVVQPPVERAAAQSAPFELAETGMDDVNLVPVVSGVVAVMVLGTGFIVGSALYQRRKSQQL